MSKSHFNQSPIDHYIQADIVRALFAASNDLTFSQLKSADVENSLFMYHVRKLTDRGVITKTDAGFRLTNQGVQWVNFIGTTLQPRMLPRLLITFIVVNTDKTKVLLSRRKGVSATELNQYLLPGGLHQYGTDLAQAAIHTLKDIHIEADSPRYLGVFEVLKTLNDDFVHHSVLFVHEVVIDEYMPSETEHYSYEWAAVDAIASDIYDRPIADVVSRYMSGTLLAFESVSF